MIFDKHSKLNDILNEFQNLSGVNQKEELKQVLISKGLNIIDSDTIVDMVIKANNIIVAKGNAQPEDVLQGKTFSNDTKSNLLGIATLNSIITKYGGFKTITGTCTGTVTEYQTHSVDYTDDGKYTETCVTGNIIIPFPSNIIPFTIRYQYNSPFSGADPLCGIIFKDGLYRIHGNISPFDSINGTWYYEEYPYLDINFPHNNLRLAKIGNSNDFFKDDHLEIPILSSPFPNGANQTFNISYTINGIQLS